jgi:hypothetical protein
VQAADRQLIEGVSKLSYYVKTARINYVKYTPLQDERKTISSLTISLKSVKYTN